MPLTEDEAIDFFKSGDKLDRQKAATILRRDHDWDNEDLLLCLQEDKNEN